jgi:hypothetical protein
MEGKTIQERIRIAGRQRLPWEEMEIDDMERACGVIDAVAAEFGDDRAYDPATQVVVDKVLHELALSMAHKWERICDGEELADVAGEGE